MYLNVIAKMEIKSEEKMHICHLKLNILGWQIIYYQQNQIFMSTMTDIFVLVYFILSIQSKRNRVLFSRVYGCFPSLG